LVLATSAATMLVPLAALASKTDHVILKNGDHITGEIKGVSRGKLDYSTDDAGRLSIEWTKVAKVTSPNPFHIEMSSGVRYFGRLNAPRRDGTLVVQDFRTDTLSVEDVIEVTPLSASFTQRVTSYLDVGFTLAKANQATTFSLSGKTTYRGPTLGSQLSYDSYAQGQESVPTTTRNTLRQSVSWYLPQRWSAIGFAQVEQNDELDLDHRFTAGGGMEREIVHTNHQELSAAAGLVGAQEEFTSETGNTSSTNLEGFVAVYWNAFRFDSPKLDFSTSFATFPSITQAGRFRGQGDLRLVYELFNDFNVGVRFNDTFDTSPPEGATNNDYITEFTIGWSYRR
jgi:Protein of unknown function, DUF481